jgi:hypothetical protein
MSVVSVELSFNGTTGGRKKNAAEYTAAYKVDTDSVLDQTATICDHFKNAGNLPYLDSPYVYANDNDPAAVCTGIDPRREAKSATRWIVTLKYETPSSEDKKNDNNQHGRGNEARHVRPGDKFGLHSVCAAARNEHSHCRRKAVVLSPGFRPGLSQHDSRQSELERHDV